MSTQSVRTLSENEVREEADAVLKGLHIAIALDKSGSMGEPSFRMSGKSKWEELEETVTAVAREAVAAGCLGGLTLIFFSSTVHVKPGVTPDEVKSVFHEFRPGGSTNLAAALEEIATIASHSKDDVLGIVYTDGMADDKNAVVSVMDKAGKDSGRPHIGFCIIQVGNDQGAKEFLEYVDDNLKIDVSSTVPFADSGELSLAKIAWLARNA
jgi:Mg-chelatase subunit ChlD